MRRLSILVLMLCSAGISEAKQAPKAAPPSFVHLGAWRQLVQPGARWELVAKVDSTAKKKPARITIETWNVHKVDDAEVAALRWTLHRDGGTADVYAKIPIARQIAVTPAGIYFFLTVLSDKEIRAALRKPPIYVEPPTAIAGRTRSDGKYLLMQGSYVCVGDGPLPPAPECHDVCTGELCIDPHSGIVSVEGNYAPDGSSFRSETYKE